MQLFEDLQLKDKTWNNTENQKKTPEFLRWSASLIFTSFSNKVVVFSCKPLPGILKYSDYRCDFNNRERKDSFR